MERERHNFFSFSTIICPFTPPPLSPPNNPENYNFEKMKRTAGYIIILQKRTINSNDS